MHRTVRYKSRAPAMQISFAIKGLAILFLLCISVRFLSTLGAETISSGFLSTFASNSGTVNSILNFELGGAAGSAQDTTISSLLLNTVYYTSDNHADNTSAAESPVSSSDSESADETATAEEFNLYFDEWSVIGADDDSFATPNIITKPAGETSATSIAVNNKTDYTIDTQALLQEPLGITLSGESPVVLIIHTHSSEAYMPDGADQYTASDPYRTEEKQYSIIRVGDELATVFDKNGIPYIHDSSIYDYPSYQGAYNRSYTSIQSYLKKYPSIKIVFDLHRDAIEAADGSVYKTIAQIDNTTCAQVLMVMGTDFSGLTHPKWRENFKLALQIQKEMNTLYPSLAKPIELSQYRYNQQATTGSMIVEIGCTGNTLREALTCARYFADAASNVIRGLYK